MLDAAEAKAFYDRFGNKQDTQSFYEEPALDDLVAHADFAAARSLFEFGCGTGRFAERLLAHHVSDEAVYRGCDVSSTMVELARARLKRFAARVQVDLADGTTRIPLGDHRVDRVICTYVLDLLAEADIQNVLTEVSRVLSAEGKACIVSLTDGTTFLSRMVSALWRAAFQIRPTLVGGCRPIRLLDHLPSPLWSVEYHNVVVAFGIPSEVLILRPATHTEFSPQ